MGQVLIWPVWCTHRALFELLLLHATKKEGEV